MPATTSQIDHYAKILWDYMHLHQPLQKADCIIVGCSYWLPVADYAAKLYQQGYAPWLLFSGKAPVLTTHVHQKSEAETFADRAIELGVPAEKILIEPEATNSEQNFVFARRLLTQKQIPVKKVLVVQKPYMERRVWATIRKHWPEVEARVTSPPIGYEEFMSGPWRQRHLVSMLGDTRRIKTYAERGFQIPQQMPSAVWEATEELIKLGITPRTDKHKDELQQIPGIGPSLAKDLRLLKLHSIADLKGKNPKQLYDQLCTLTHSHQDPCVLYTFRCAVYFASTPHPDPEKTKWWYWKHDTINETAAK